jgi:tripeptide aminopeptidase
MTTARTSVAQLRITRLATMLPVHRAFHWLHLHQRQLRQWQLEFLAIPAPPFGESERAVWFLKQFESLGLANAHLDAEGNALAELRSAQADPAHPYLLLSAHVDTVFPAGTDTTPREAEDSPKILGPGSCDNGAGLTGLLAVIAALRHADIAPPIPILFCANVGEEGEGDLRGARHLYADAALAGRIAAHIVLDGAGADSAVTQALGSRRYQVVIRGPGGHSFTDAGTPNPIAALATALAALAETPIPAEPRTTLNVGTIHGGTSVNSIPESAQAAIDFRSTDPEQLVRLEVALHRAVEDSVEHWNGVAKNQVKPHHGRLSYTISKIGDRPPASLPEDSPLLETLRAVDRHLGQRTDLRLGSTDANIPLARGVPAISMGAGGEGGGAHTRLEWYSAKNREAGLKRVLLLTLAMTEWAASQ